jgi:hypothetical protein
MSACVHFGLVILSMLDIVILSMLDIVILSLSMNLVLVDLCWICDIEMNVYMYVLYIMCVMCRFSNFSYANYIFYTMFLQHRITYDGWVGRRKLATLIYVGQAQPS